MINKRQGFTAIAMAVTVIGSSFLMQPSWAQRSLGDQMLDGALGVAKKRLQEAVPGAGGGSTTGQPARIVPSVPPAPANQLPLPWPNKVALLDAARRGEFRGLPEIRSEVEKETAPLTNSVIRILRFEYMVPPLSGNDSIGTCRGAASEEIRRLLTGITNLQIQGLSDTPPNFYRETNVSSSQQNIELEMRKLGTAGGWCVTKVLGVDKPHPYGAALSKLALEFSAATKAYVEAERALRVATYAQEQAQLQAERQDRANAQAQRDADTRAAEQKRISGERARIEAEQIKRQRLEKSRVAG